MDVEKKIPLIKKKFFLFALVTTSWNCKKCSTSKIFRCKFCVKSNFANVNAHILLFSFIANYEDGQNRIMQSLKPTRVTAWKTSKYRVFYGPYFPAFGLNTGKYGPEKTPYLNIFHAMIDNHYMFSEEERTG